MQDLLKLKFTAKDLDWTPLFFILKGYFFFCEVCSKELLQGELNFALPIQHKKSKST